MDNKEAINLALRYFVLIFLGVALYLGLFDFILRPLTYWSVYFILSLIYNNVNSMSGWILFYGPSIYAEIISACVAGAAYYLLLVLNLTTPMSYLKRIYSILLLVGVFLVLNILRIVAFAVIAAGGGNYFDLAHMMMWYFGSTVIVVIVWFLAVALLNIKEIPIYSDMKGLYEDAISNKRRK